MCNTSYNTYNKGYNIYKQQYIKEKTTINTIKCNIYNKKYNNTIITTNVQ